MKYIIETTPSFDKWLAKLKDKQAIYSISLRVARAEDGNLGDTKPVGSGISEMRIFTGKGYRVYFTIRENILVLLLNGGNKSSKKQQQDDIAEAKRILSELED